MTTSSHCCLLRCNPTIISGLVLRSKDNHIPSTHITAGIHFNNGQSRVTARRNGARLVDGVGSLIQLINQRNRYPFLADDRRLFGEVRVLGFLQRRWLGELNMKIISDIFDVLLQGTHHAAKLNIVVTH